MTLLNAKPVDFDQTWKELECAITGLDLDKGMAYDRWIQMYTSVYKMCTNPSKPDVLYFRLKACLEAHVIGIHKSLKKGRKEFLVDYLNKWTTYHTVWTYAQHIFSYLDRWWIPNNLLEGSGTPGVYPIFSLAVVVWRDHVFYRVKDTLFNGIMSLITSERLGEKTDGRLIRGLIESYEKLGVNLPNPLSIYKDEFEAGFLAETLEFYLRASSAALTGSTVYCYMSQVEKWLDDELRRGQMYLESSSIIEMKRTVEAALITRHKDILYGECDAVLTEDRRQDLQRMYGLLSRTEKGLLPLQDSVRKHVEVLGTAALNALDANGAKDPKTFVDTIWKVYQHAAELVRTAFSNDPGFVAALDQACRKFMNLNPRSAELLAKYCHNILERGGRRLDDTQLDDALSNVNSVFRFIDNKDVFQKFYSKLLAKRLIQDSSVSDEAEEMVIKNLKHTCGYEYTSKLQRMFTDKSISKEINNKFHAHLHSNSANSIPVDTSMMVLTAGSWPLQTATGTFNLPPELGRCMQSFSDFYHGHHSGRKLFWIHQLSKADVRTLYTRQRYELQVSTYQLAILLMYNNSSLPSPHISYEEIRNTTALPDSDLSRTLASLVKARILLSSSEDLADFPSTSSFLLNKEFSSKRTRIKVSATMLQETAQESDVVHKAVEEDRRMSIQAAIVRIMKARKEMTHNALVVETIAVLQHRFQPRVADIKSNIDSLTEKEYISRSEGNMSVYHYVA